MKLFKFKHFLFAFIPLSIIPTSILFYSPSKHFLVFALAMACFFFAYIMAIKFAENKTRKARLEYIKAYKFPNIVCKKFLGEHKYLSIEQAEQVAEALKQFFMAYALCNDGGKKPKDGFMMPSRIADELWHQFMLDSANYEKFCKTAYGKMLHHKPGADNGGNKNLRFMKSFPKSVNNIYLYMEKLKEYGEHKSINGIPLLFAIDSYLKIDKGFYYDVQTMTNLSASIKSAAIASASSGSSGDCAGFLAADTLGSCGSGGDCSGCGGGCGGGCSD
jgi:hypothetical protein